MSCMLRLSGRHLDIADLLGRLSFQPHRTWHTGDPDHRGGLSQSSGASFVVSSAEMSEFETQLQECASFLERHGAEIHMAATHPAVERATLDFGIELRDVVVHVDVLPAKLIALAGQCGVGIALSHYPASNSGAES